MRMHRVTFFCAGIFTLILTAAVGVAAPVTFPSGETVDLNRKQVDLLKQQRGLYYVGYPQRDLIPAKTSDRVVVEVPETLGGGFLIGFPEDFQKGLAAVQTAGASHGANEQMPGAAADKKTHKKSNRPVHTQFGLDTGYRFDELQWNIAGNLSGDNPNILSELTWEDLQTFQVKLSNATTIKEALHLRGYIDYGWIHAGDNQDSDYAGDDRMLEWSRSNNSGDDGEMLDGSLGIGYRLTFKNDRIELIPLIGYSYHEQNLTITDGYQTIPATGSFPGLDSTYETQWYGPWLGVDVKVRTRERNAFIRRAVIYASLEGHSVDYEAEANWNLRDDFAHPKSFEHEADGLGVIVKLGAHLFFAEHWALHIGYDFSYWETDEGTDVVYFADGTSGATQLNEVVWKSHLISLGIAYRL